MSYVAMGAAAPPKKAELLPTAPNRDLPAATRTACKAAAKAGQYVDYLACYDAVRGGAPVPTIDAPLTEAEAAHSRTSLYVGLGIAVAVVGVGGYLLFGRH